MQALVPTYNFFQGPILNQNKDNFLKFYYILRGN